MASDADDRDTGLTTGSIPVEIPPVADPQAQGRLEALLASPSYREADRDLDFLSHDAARAVRLQLDFLKPEVTLAAKGIAHTIVVLGSARILDPAAAHRRLEACRSAFAIDPASAEKRRDLARAERALENSRYYDIAREFGRLVGAAQRPVDGERVAILTGGGPGIMEAGNRGAFDAQAESIGLNIRLPAEQFPNSYISPDLCFRFHYFAMRKLHFLLRTKALVAFPGGFGTFDELFETLTLVQTHKVDPFPIVLVGAGFWRKAFDADFLIEQGMISPPDRQLYRFAESAREIWDAILDWHRARGTRLAGDDLASPAEPRLERGSRDAPPDSG